MQMQKSRFTSLMSLLLAAFVLAGCASTSTEPVPEPEPVEQPAPVEAPAPEPEPVQSDFDSAGNAIDANGRPLSRTFYFDYDKSVLKPADLGALEMHAQILRRNPDRSVVLEGHCDERGTREYNLALGERRAQSVADVFMALGVSAANIENVSYGEENPVADGHDDSAWRLNRRVEIRYDR